MESPEPQWQHRRRKRAKRAVQTGGLRQYVMFLAVGTVALFLLITFYFSYTAGGG